MTVTSIESLPQLTVSVSSGALSGSEAGVTVAIAVVASSVNI